MTIENPPKLWACVCFVGGPPGICADFERDDVLCDRPGAAPAEGYTPIVAYVREDVAAEREDAARREERERVLALLTAERERVRGKTSDVYLDALDWLEEAAKGQGK